MRSTTKILLGILIGLSFAAATTYAWSTTWHGTDWIADGESINAQKIAENFEYLRGKVEGNSDSVPAGAVMAFNLVSCPSGWSEYTRAQGRTVVGLSSSESEFDTLNERGGEKTHTLTLAEMPRHRHSLSTAAPKTSVGGPGYYNGSTGTVNLGEDAGYSGYSGSSAAHNNLQPYVALLYCVKD